jgi:hypothetical protein
MTTLELKLQFIENCNKGFCTRKTFKSKRCLKDSKQNECFEKWIIQREKDFIKNIQVDEEWEFVKQQVWRRDKGECQVELTLTPELVRIIRKQWDYMYRKFDGVLDCMHILPRSSYPQLLYDIDNIILGGRFYHSFIDKSLNFVTGKYEKGFRERMLTQIMQSTNRWNKDFSYEDFKKEKS